MQAIQDFLQWVFPEIPKEHTIVGCYRYKGNYSEYWVNKNYSTVAEAATAFTKLADSRKDTYYGIGLFKNNLEYNKDGRPVVRRTKPYASQFRVIAFDIDVGEKKDYATFDEALEALDRIMPGIGFPRTCYTVVRSGGGIHCYIKLVKYHLKKDWEEITTLLKKALMNNNLKIDASKINDSSMVLRPVGTYNFKQPTKPRPVEIIRWGQDELTLRAIRNTLATYKSPIQVELNPVDVLMNVVPIVGANTAIEWNTLQKAESKIIESRCNQIKLMAENADVPEPLWYATLGVATHCIDDVEAAERWSSANYPRYDRTKTLVKMAQWRRSTTGPATCVNFFNIHPDGCKGCPYQGKIKTPVQFNEMGEPTAKSQEGRQIKLPTGYFIDKKNQIAMLNEDGEFQLVSTYLIYLESMASYTDERNPVTFLRYKMQIPNVGWKTLELEASMLYSSGRNAGFASLLGQAQVFLPANLAKRVQDYAIACAHQHIQENVASKVVSQFGWTKDDTFIYGYNEYRGVMEPPIPVTLKGNATNDLARGFHRRGSLENWLVAVKCLADKDLNYQAFGYLLAYGAPLLKFTKLGGAIVNLYSENTGSGKSTALNFMNSVYGDPNSLRAIAQDTDNTFFARLATLNNLPANIDEISDNHGNKTSNMLYYVSMGQEKGRMNKDGGLREQKRWNLLTLTTSNKSLFDKLDLHSSSTQGQRARMFEITIDYRPVIDKFGKMMNLLIMSNYGHAGEMYLAHLTQLKKDNQIEKIVTNAQSDFEKHFKFQFDGQERFWAAMICVTWRASLIAKDLGLTPSFEIDYIFNSILKIVENNRRKLQSAVETAAMVVDGFIASYVDKFVKVRNVFGSPPQASLPYGSIMGRIETFYANQNDTIPESGIITISHSDFKNYCKDNIKPYHKYFEDIKNMPGFMDHTPVLTSGVKTDARGGPVAPVKLNCFSIDIPYQYLEEYNMSVNSKGPEDDGYVPF